MNKMMKIVSVVAAGLLMAQCSATYKMKSEKGKVCLKLNGEWEVR